MSILSRDKIVRFLKALVFIIDIMVFCNLLYSQDDNENLHFNHLSIENGLSVNIVNKIIQDSLDYIWIGTPNGLNRYNGSGISVYYHNPADSTTISNNEISAFSIDNDGDFWIGTKNGLCRYNYEQENFERYLQYGPGERNSISSLFTDKRNQLWVGTEHGLFRFDKHSNTFSKMISDDAINLNAPISFAEQANGNLFVGTWEKGLYLIGERGLHTRETIVLSDNRTSSGLNTIESILIDNNNSIWLSSREGVVRASESGEMGKSKYKYSLFENYHSSDSPKLDKNTHALCEDNFGRIWIGTENGLGIYNPLTNRLDKYFNDPDDPYSLSNNHIKQIYKDRNGSIWLGTYQGGVTVFHPNQEWFRNYFPDINDARDQKKRYVKSVFQDSHGIIWMGTDIGLFKFSAGGKLLNSYNHNPSDKNSLNIGGVSAMFEDNKGRFWIGTWGGGVHQLNTVTGKFTRLPWKEGVHDHPESQGDLSIRAITQDKEGNLWFGSVRGYLDKYNPETKHFEHYRILINETDINAIILDLQFDKSNNLWIGTQGGGLLVFDTRTKALIRYGGISNTEIHSDSTLKSTDVFSMYFSDDGLLWLATSNGLQVLDIEKNTFHSYTVKDGLPSNTVYKILPDDYGNLWISTLTGISRFNLSGKVFNNYDGRDGIRINSECGFRNSSGWIFFGGVNGVNAINTSSIKGNSFVPPVVFTNLRIFNKSVYPGNKSILKKSINHTEELAIPYNQNVFSIEFAALNYTNPGKNQYKCKLAGFDQDWVFLGSSNEARYTNLSPGSYTLHVSASNNDGVWNEKGRVLKIVILPPWWKTWWFRLLMLTSAFLIILSWILIRTFRLRDQQKN